MNEKRDLAEYVMLFHNPEGVKKVQEHREYVLSGQKAEVEHIFEQQVEKLFGKGLGIDKKHNNKEDLPQEIIRDEVVLKKTKKDQR